MGSTAVEKIISSALGRNISEGEFVEAPVDFAYFHDGTGPLIIDALKEMGVDPIKDKEKAGIVFDQSGKPMHSHGEDEKHPISDDELRKLSAFTDFINTLDMKDLGNAGDSQDQKDQQE